MRNLWQKAAFIRNYARWQIYNYSEPSRYDRTVKIGNGGRQAAGVDGNESFD